MTPATKSAPGRCVTSGAGATRKPILGSRTDPVDDILHHRLIRRAQRHAAQSRAAASVELQRRMGTLEVLQQATHDWVAGWIPAGFPPPRLAPESVRSQGHPESLTAELDPADEVMLAAYASDLWPADEYLGITADRDAPAVTCGPVYVCPACGSVYSGGTHKCRAGAS